MQAWAHRQLLFSHTLSLLNNKAAAYSIDRLIENNLKGGFGGIEVVLSLRPPLDSSASAFDLY